MRPWLQFFRIRLAPTAISNVVAGVALGGWFLEPTQWLVLIGWTLLLYMFGMGFNDWLDRSVDAKIAPHRPLPAGAISLTRAKIALTALAFPVALLPFAMPEEARFFAFAAAGCAILYDLALKQIPLLGPLAMGGVRFSVVMTAASYAGSPHLAQTHALTIGLFTAAITFFSQAEETGNPKQLARRHALIALVVVASYLFEQYRAEQIPVAFLAVTGLILLWLLQGLAFRRGASADFCTFTMLMALPLVDLRATVTYPLLLVPGLVVLAWLAIAPWSLWIKTPRRSE